MRRFEAHLKRANPQRYFAEPSNGHGGDGAGESMAAAFQAEELAGLRMATIGAVAALLVIGMVLPFIAIVPLPTLIYIESFVLVFAALSFGRYWVRRRRPDRGAPDYVFVALNFVVLAFVLVAPTPFLGYDWPVQMQLRYGNFVYFFLFLAIVALSYSPRLMLWAGLAAALAWAAAGAWVATRPDSVTHLSVAMIQASPSTALGVLLDPRFVNVNDLIKDVVVLLVVSALLAVGVWRSRRLVLRQVTTVRERDNLSRYFAPSIVERLAQLDRPLEDVRTQVVTVLFGDIVGFSRMSEREEPRRVIALLRGFHSRMEAAVFDHGGTLDKFIGDGVMATFGTPDVGERDAANALACARAMIAAVEAWNAEREAAGGPPIRLSIGVHCGTVVQGNVGSQRRLEFTVLGDVVNVSSRLERLTRELGCRIVASGDAVRAAREQAGGDDASVLEGFERDRSRSLRGREAPVEIWTFGTAA